MSLSGIDTSTNSISACTDGTHTNFLGLPAECTNSKVMLQYRRKGTQFRIDRLDNRVQIYSLPTASSSFICNFTTVGPEGPLNEPLIPWISIENTAGIVEVSTIMKGMGGIYDFHHVCPVRVAPFVEKTCYPDFYDAGLVQDSGKFYSSGNF